LFFSLPPDALRGVNSPWPMFPPFAATWQPSDHLFPPPGRLSPTFSIEAPIRSFPAFFPFPPAPFLVSVLTRFGKFSSVLLYSFPAFSSCTSMMGRMDFPPYRPPASLCQLIGLFVWLCLDAPLFTTTFLSFVTALRRDVDPLSSPSQQWGDNPRSPIFRPPPWICSPLVLSR